MIRLVLTAWAILVSLGSFIGCGSKSDMSGDPDAGIDGGDRPPCKRRVLENEVTNARDLGEHPLSNGNYTLCNTILRGGDLTGLSESGCEEFSKLDIRTVIDLRMESTQQSQPAPTCVSEHTAITPAPMPKLPETPENYLALMQEKDAIATVFTYLGNPEAYPVYIHCVIGRDRASFVTALALLALGANRQTIIEEFMLSEEAGVAVKSECLEAVLEEIETIGGIQAFLLSVGVSNTQLEVLRKELTSNS